MTIRRSEEPIEAYALQKHPGGGWLSEVYAALFHAQGRSLAVDPGLF